MNVVALPGPVTLVVEAPVTKRCPFRDEVDEGEVRIEWPTALTSPELHGLAEYLQGFAEQELTHEAFAVQVRQDLAAAKVTGTWTTAGMRVTATA